jgi:TonB family protein
MLAQMVLAYVAMNRIRRRAGPFLSAEENGVPVLETPRGGMPMSFGLWKPVIFMPADAAQWSEERRRMVLLHELAHVRRGDIATHLLARAALSLHWWNPLVWMAWRRFLKERERAADDLVLAAGARAADYAGHLLEVARSLQSSPATAWAAVAMARRSQLEGRLLAILDSQVSRGKAGRTTVALAVLLAVVLAAPFAAIRAQDRSAQAVPPEIDATIRAANAQKNHEILEHAAAAYEELRKFEAAKTLLESALAIRAETAGQQSAKYAAGLVKLGDLAVQARNFGEAESFYNKAIALGDRPEVASALFYMAYRQRYPAQTYEMLERAVRLAPEGRDAGQAFAWMAAFRERQPDGLAEAESLYQRALRIHEAKSADAANTMVLYSRLLRNQSRNAEAEALDLQAKQIREASAGDKIQPRPEGVYRVGGGVSAPALLHKVEPAYTEAARAAKYQGTVLVYAEIGPDGRAGNIRVIRGLGSGLDEKAIEAISQWRFRPGMKDGQPVTVAATIEVNFRLM